MRRSMLIGVLIALLLVPTSVLADPIVPSGFQIAPVIQKIHHPTRLAWGPDGRLYIAQQTGEVIAVQLKNGQEVARDQVLKVKANLLGITLKDDKLWISETGKIAVYTRAPDGRYDGRKDLVTGLPVGLHQNDGFAWGPDGKLYFGMGSKEDKGPEDHPWSGTIMRMNPDGTGLEVYAKGLRNPYGIGFAPDGKLWANDNGVDDPPTPDELNLVVQGGDYGYPKVFGMPPAGSATRAPSALFGDHNSTNGLVIYTGEQFPQAYRGGIFVAQWGSSFDDTTGRAVGFVDVSDPAKGKVSTFATGFSRPLDVAMGPEGDLWVADFVAGIVYRVWYAGGSGGPGSGPGPGQPGQPSPGQPTPGQPGQPAPGQPGQPTPGQPGQPAPGQPGQPTPGQPGPTTPPAQPKPAPLPGAPGGSNLLVWVLLGAGGVLVLGAGLWLSHRRR